MPRPDQRDTAAQILALALIGAGACMIVAVLFGGC